VDHFDEGLADPAVQSVYIATPVSSTRHRRFNLFVREKQWLCEKPMAMNDAEARAMVKLAEETGRTFGRGLLSANVSQTAAGQTTDPSRRNREAGSCRTHQPRMVDPRSFDEGNTDRSWLIDPVKAGGGPLYDIASHRIDVLNFLFWSALRATGYLSNAVHHMRSRDNATVMIDYAGGVRGSGGRALAFDGEAGRMPHPRHRRRDGVESTEWPRTYLSRRP